MLLCPTAWGWGKSSVPSRAWLQVAPVNSEERSSTSLLSSIHLSLQHGHTRAGLTHLCLLDFFSPRKMYNILLVLARGDQLASVLGLTCGKSIQIPYFYLASPSAHCLLWSLSQNCWDSEQQHSSSMENLRVLSCTLLRKDMAVYCLSWVQQHHVHAP